MTTFSTLRDGVWVDKADTPGTPFTGYFLVNNKDTATPELIAASYAEALREAGLSAIDHNGIRLRTAYLPGDQLETVQASGLPHTLHQGREAVSDLTERESDPFVPKFWQKGPLFPGKMVEVTLVEVVLDEECRSQAAARVKPESAEGFGGRGSNDFLGRVAAELIQAQQSVKSA